MTAAYEHLAGVFGALARVDEAFFQASMRLSKLPNTEATYSFSHFGNYTVHGTSETGTSWEIEVAAKRDGTEARWHLEIDLMHSSESCELSADAGYQGKYGPMEVREIGPVCVVELKNLGTQLDCVLEELFSDLDGDCRAAIEADLEEMRSFGRARETASKEQGNGGERSSTGA